MLILLIILDLLRWILVVVVAVVIHHKDVVIDVTIVAVAIFYRIIATIIRIGLVIIGSITTTSIVCFIHNFYVIA